MIENNDTMNMNNHIFRLAIENGYLEIAKFFIEDKNIEKSDTDVLLYTSRIGHLEIIKLLVKMNGIVLDQSIQIAAEYGVIWKLSNF